MDINPWQVKSIQEFSFLKCPECTFDSKEEHTFQDHAIENHPLSFTLFGKALKEEYFEDPLTFEEHKLDLEEDLNLKNEPKNLFLSSISDEESFDKPEGSEDNENHSNNVAIDHKKLYQSDNLVHEEKKLYQCTWCEAKFKTNYELKNHKERVHEGEKCDKTFLHEFQTKVAHEKARHHKCSLCDYSSGYSSNLKKHMSNIHKKEKPYKCFEFFEDPLTFEEHNLDIEEDFDLKNEPENLRVHEYHNSKFHDGKKPGAHEGSQLISKDRKVLKQEVLSIDALSVKRHSSVPLVPEAKTSNMIATLPKSDVNKHISTFHGQGSTPKISEFDKKIQCSTCFKDFLTKYSLKEHISSAHGKDFRCPFCFKNFSCKDELNIHLSEVHEKKEIEKNKLQCPLCPTKFIFKGELNRHLSKVHEGKKLPIKKKSKWNLSKFPCHICSRLFRTQFAFNNHVSKVHEEFKCSICFKVFGEKATLIRHSSYVHEKNMPYQCPFCPVTFGYRNYFDKHLTMFHKGKELSSQDAYQKVHDMLNNSNSLQDISEMILPD